MFSTAVLDLDCEAAANSIAAILREQVLGKLRRKGLVVGISGGIDSATVAALAVRALGPERVFGVFMPERDSSDDSLRFGQALASKLGIDATLEDLTPMLEGAGCYARQLEAIRMVFPEYGEGWRMKVALPSLLDGDRLNVTQLVVRDPNGNMRQARLSPVAYRQLIAATNFKQRARTMLEYYHADRLGHAVAGTPNRLEYDQGFFVKQGDGAADVKPIAHLYKTQVYAMARHLGVPPEICSRAPTTDTYSLEQTQEEFYFALPYDRMDLCLYAYNHKVNPEQAATVIGLTPQQLERVYRDIEAKRRTTAYLHAAPLLIEPVSLG